MLDSVAETKLPDKIKAALCANSSHPRILPRVSKPLEERPTDPRTSQPARATSYTRVPTFGPPEAAAPVPSRAQVQG
jgi:hypothetical protein